MYRVISEYFFQIRNFRHSRVSFDNPPLDIWFWLNMIESEIIWNDKAATTTLHNSSGNRGNFFLQLWNPVFNSTNQAEFQLISWISADFQRRISWSLRGPISARLSHDYRYDNRAKRRTDNAFRNYVCVTLRTNLENLHLQKNVQERTQNNTREVWSVHLVWIPCFEMNVWRLQELSFETRCTDSSIMES